jgi:hypothetical protein
VCRLPVQQPLEVRSCASIISARLCTTIRVAFAKLEGDDPGAACFCSNTRSHQRRPRWDYCDYGKDTCQAEGLISISEGDIKAITRNSILWNWRDRLLALSVVP